MIWDKRVYEKIDYVVGCFSVSIVLKGVVDGSVWICTSAYGPTAAGLRDALWTKLDSVKVRWSSTWCVFGDFNIIISPAKRLSCTFFSTAMLKLLNFIERNFLVDLLLIGMSIHGFMTPRTFLCLELIEFWCPLTGRITSSM